MKYSPLAINEKHQQWLEKYYSYPESRKKIIFNSEGAIAPQFLYKFKPSPFSAQSEAEIEESKNRLKKILIDGDLFLSSYKNFNDPFDVCPAYQTSLDDEQIRLNLIRILNENKIPLSELRIDIDSIINKYKEKNVIENLINEIQNSTQLTGIFCFTREYENTLMWSHYAGSHTGICIKFNLINQIELAQRIFPIEYTNQRPKLNLFQKQDFESYKKMFLTKSEDWQYENEWRLTLPNYANQTIPLNENVLEEILIGAKASEKTINLIETINSERKNNNLPEFKITRTKIHDTEFKIVTMPPNHTTQQPPY